MELDEIDRKILKALSENARKSLREIAKELGVSTVTVINRIKKLKENKVLRGYSALVDPKKCGYGMTGLINIICERKHLIEIEEKLAKHPNVIGVYDVTGEFDAVIVGRFRDIEDMNAFVKKSLALPGITRTYTQVALNVFKEDFTVKF